MFRIARFVGFGSFVAACFASWVAFRIARFVLWVVLGSLVLLAIRSWFRRSASRGSRDPHRGVRVVYCDAAGLSAMHGVRAIRDSRDGRFGRIEGIECIECGSPVSGIVSSGSHRGVRDVRLSGGLHGSHRGVRDGHRAEFAGFGRDAGRGVRIGRFARETRGSSERFGRRESFGHRAIRDERIARFLRFVLVAALLTLGLTWYRAT